MVLTVKAGKAITTEYLRRTPRNAMNWKKGARDECPCNLLTEIGWLYNKAVGQWGIGIWNGMPIHGRRMICMEM